MCKLRKAHVCRKDGGNRCRRGASQSAQERCLGKIFSQVSDKAAASACTTRQQQGHPADVVCRQEHAPENCNGHRTTA